MLYGLEEQMFGYRHLLVECQVKASRSRVAYVVLQDLKVTPLRRRAQHQLRHRTRRTTAVRPQRHGFPRACSEDVEASVPLYLPTQTM